MFGHLKMSPLWIILTLLSPAIVKRTHCQLQTVIPTAKRNLSECESKWDRCLNVNSDFYGGDYTTEEIPGPTQMMRENKKIFEKRNCFCDRKCQEFNDCCFDVPKEPSSFLLGENRKKWTCSKIPNSLPTGVQYIYMQSSCPKFWSSNHIRSKCEMPPGSNVNYMQQIPVLSKKTNVTYTNIYCAICNRDTEVHGWNLTITCSGGIPAGELNNSTLLSDNNYNPDERSWKFLYGSRKMVKCTIHVSEFTKDYALKSNSRACRQKIDFCPKDWKNLGDSKKCSQYSAYRYLLDTTYNNKYCAKCNGIAEDVLKCSKVRRYFGGAKRTGVGGSKAGTSGSARPTGFGVYSHGYGPPIFPRTKTRRKKYTSISVLFHIEGVSGNMCDSGEIFDPLRSQCLLVQCGRLFKMEDGQCVADDTKMYLNNSITSTCETVPVPSEQYVVLSDESIWVNFTQKTYKKGSYEFSDTDNQSAQRLTICITTGDFGLTDFLLSQAILSEICLYISTVCLMLHVLSYILIPKLMNLPGKNLMSLSGSLLIAQTTFIFGITKTSNPVLCKTIAILLHYFFLAYFFWLNVMAIDIFRTFRGSGRRNTANTKNFYIYSLYAWLATTLIVTCAVIVENTSIFGGELQPVYGSSLCWLGNTKASIIFFATPITMIVAVNIILFIATAYYIWKANKVAKLAVKRPEKIRYLLYMKLGVVMGMTWTLAYLALFVSCKIFCHLYIIFNGLQGAFIFVAFTCKKKVYNELKKLVYCKNEKKPKQKKLSKGDSSTSNTFMTTFSNGFAKRSVDLQNRTSKTDNTGVGPQHQSYKSHPSPVFQNNEQKNVPENNEKKSGV